MRLLMANLLILGQYYNAMGVGLCCCVFVFSVLGTALTGGSLPFIFLVQMTLFTGYWVVTAQDMVSSNPFSSRLPGYQENARRFVLVFGLTVSTIVGLSFGLSQVLAHAPANQVVLAGCLGLFIAAIAYLIGVAAMFMLGNALSLAWPLSFVFVGQYKDKVRIFLMHHPVLIVSLFVFMVAAVWWWLGRPQWLEKRRAKFVGSRASLSISRTSRSEQERHQVAAWVNTLPQYPATETCFARLVRNGRPFSPLKYFWGAVYASLLPWVLLRAARWRRVSRFMLVWLLLVPAAGYSALLSIPLRCFLVSLALDFFGNGLIVLPLFSSSLVTGGRRERLYVTIAAASVLVAAVVVILTLPLLGWSLLASLLPRIGSGDSAMVFHPVSPWLPMLCMIVIPPVGLSFCWEHDRDDDDIQRAMIVVLEYIALFVFCFLLPHASLRIQLTAAAVSALIFILGVRRIALRGDLVRQ
jgi:hypothetical protein